MRILVAIDGSEPSNLATELVGNLIWPAGTTIRLVTVEPYLDTMFGEPWMAMAPPSSLDIEEELVQRQNVLLEAAAQVLKRPGLTVETSVPRGRPATAIVQEATEVGSDLIVLGARGHGQWESTLLGSVSAEVVDHAPCPALVARMPTLERIVLAEDGSEGAAGARTLLAGWPPLASVPVRVVSVVSVPAPWQSGVSPLLMEAAFEAYRDSLRQTRDRLNVVARGTADGLAAGGRQTGAEVRVGDPAREVVAVATEFGASLIVMGSRGITGLRRLLLGSVARNVLHHAPCSVLIVRRQVADHVGAAAPGAATVSPPPV